MTEYEESISNANAIGIDVIEIDLEANDGFYCDNTIFINKNIETDTEKYCVMNEELGHHFTTVGDISNQKKLENIKKEHIARRWGYEHSVTLIGLIEAFEYGFKNSYEIAEFLGVTEKFLIECIEDYKKKYGVYKNVEQYCIIFEPYLNIGKRFGYNKQAF